MPDANFGAAAPPAVLEAARGLRTEVQAREQRSVTATQALEAEGLQAWASQVEGWDAWVETGVGSLEALVAAARELEQAEQARLARRAGIEQLLAEEGLLEHVSFYSGAALRYVHYGEGSEAGVLTAAREEAAKAAIRNERRAALNAALQAEDIPLHYASSLGATNAFVAYGERSIDEGECAKGAAALPAPHPDLQLTRDLAFLAPPDPHPPFLTCSAGICPAGAPAGAGDHRAPRRPDSRLSGSRHAAGAVGVAPDRRGRVPAPGRGQRRGAGGGGAGYGRCGAAGRGAARLRGVRLEAAGARCLAAAKAVERGARRD